MTSADQIRDGLPRCRRLIQEAIQTLGLNLQGLSVLTEAATGWYVLTPLIAALAGAAEVIALTRDTRYGTVEEVKARTAAAAEILGCPPVITVTNERSHAALQKVDIVTNLGMVRPIDAPLLARLKPTAVIPLMWETWEYRPGDLDFAECMRLGIPVLGTNEHHPALQIFPYVGLLALKLCFEAGIEVHRSRIVVAGRGEFAELAVHSLRQAGAEVHFADTAAPGSLRRADCTAALAAADALIVADHFHEHCLLGEGGEFSGNSLAAINSSLTVLHITGAADRESLTKAGLRALPEIFAPAGHMSVTADHLGPRPLIDLHTAGLKVGEEMARARLRGESGLSIMQSLPGRQSLAQGFSAA